MTLTKKKSRGITVQNQRYRFQVSTTKLDENYNFSLNLTVQHELSGGAVLKVNGLMTRDFWLDFSDLGSDWNKGDYPIILPRHISKIIELALLAGWSPTAKGLAFEISTDNESFFK
jgi:hypothetical protein